MYNYWKYYFLLLLVVCISCKKDKTVENSGGTASVNGTGGISFKIGGNSYSCNLNNGNYTNNNNIQGCTSSILNFELNAFGAIYCSSKNSISSIDTTPLYSNYHTFNNNNVYFDLFNLGAKKFQYEIPDSEYCVPNNPQSCGIYIRLFETNGTFREWDSYKKVNNVNLCPNPNKSFVVSYKNILNQNYDNSKSGMDKFPAVFVNGNFNCELYSVNNLGQIDSIKMEDASFGGKFIEYLSQ